MFFCFFVFVFLQIFVVWPRSSLSMVLALTSSSLVSTSWRFHKHLFLDWLTSSTRPTTLAISHCPVLRLVNVQQPLRQFGCSPSLPVHLLTHAQAGARQIHLEFTLLAFGGGWETVSRAAKPYRVALGLGKLEVISVYKTGRWIDTDFVETETKQEKNGSTSKSNFLSSIYFYDSLNKWRQSQNLKYWLSKYFLWSKTYLVVPQ